MFYLYYTVNKKSHPYSTYNKTNVKFNELHFTRFVNLKRKEKDNVVSLTSNTAKRKRFLSQL